MDEGLAIWLVWLGMGAISTLGVVRHARTWCRLRRVLHYMRRVGINGHHRWAADALARSAGFRATTKLIIAMFVLWQVLALGWPPLIISDWSWGVAWWVDMLLVVLNSWTVQERRAAERLDALNARLEAV